MTEPTDDELDAVLCHQWPAFSMQATLVRMWVRAAMRDAIAKWGTPPAVAGEPIGYCHEIKWRAHQSEQVQKITRKAHPEYGYTQALYTTPQPTQVQAGAVPLTQAQIVEAFCELPHQVQFVTAFDQGVRFAERHHGITGGQHGTE